MGKQIIQQPDGRWAIFSSVTDMFLITDATAAEILDIVGEEAKAAERESASRTMKELSEGIRRGFSLTWPEAVKTDRRSRKRNGID